MGGRCGSIRSSMVVHSEKRRILRPSSVRIETSSPPDNTSQPAGVSAFKDVSLSFPDAGPPVLAVDVPAFLLRVADSDNGDGIFAAIAAWILLDQSLALIQIIGCVIENLHFII